MLSLNIRKKSGFTLIELLVVVSIISLLSSIALVAFDSARNKTRLVAVNLNIKALFTQAELYFADNNFYIATEASGACGTLGGFLATEKSAEIMTEISKQSGIPATNNGFYCNVEQKHWSMAISVNGLVGSNTLLCAATHRGQILTIENSNNSGPSDYVITGNCVLES